MATITFIAILIRSLLSYLLMAQVRRGLGEDKMVVVTKALVLQHVLLGLDRYGVEHALLFEILIFNVRGDLFTGCLVMHGHLVLLKHWLRWHYINMPAVVTDVPSVRIHTTLIRHTSADLSKCQLVYIGPLLHLAHVIPRRLQRTLPIVNCLRWRYLSVDEIFVVTQQISHFSRTVR